MKMVSGRALSS